MYVHARIYWDFFLALSKICFQLEINFYFYAFYVYIFLRQRDKKKSRFSSSTLISVSHLWTVVKNFEAFKNFITNHLEYFIVKIGNGEELRNFSCRHIRMHSLISCYIGTNVIHEFFFKNSYIHVSLQVFFACLYEIEKCVQKTF